MQFGPALTGIVDYYSSYYDRMYDSVFHHKRRYSRGVVYEVAPQAAVEDKYSPLFAPLIGGMVSAIDFGKPYLNQDMDPVVGLFQQKTSFGKGVIEDLLADMTFRYELLQEHLGALDHYICEVGSEILQLPYFQWGIARDVDKVKTALEGRVQELELQKLDETRDCWKDLNRVKTDLVEWLQEYVSARSSGAFLNSQGGGQHY